MKRRNLARLALAAVAGVGLAAANGTAQPVSDIEAIKATRSAFYAALSAMDLKAMQAVWANKPYVVVIGPMSKAAAVGYENAVTNYWPATFARFRQISASTSAIAQLQTDGKLAWVVGTESVVGERQDGVPVKYTALFTDILEKEDGQWRMISHHAQRIPE